MLVIFVYLFSVLLDHVYLQGKAERMSGNRTEFPHCRLVVDALTVVFVKHNWIV